MLFYAILAVGSIAVAATLVGLFRLIALVGRANLALRRSRENPPRDRNHKVRSLRGLTGLEPATLRPRYRERAALQKPWGW